MHIMGESVQLVARPAHVLLLLLRMDADTTHSPERRCTSILGGCSSTVGGGKQSSHTVGALISVPLRCLSIRERVLSILHLIGGVALLPL